MAIVEINITPLGTSASVHDWERHTMNRKVRSVEEKL